MDNKERITLVSEKDLEISYFVGPGHGGQKKQKTHSGVNIIHRESGAVGRCSEDRSQARNKRTAFERMIKTPKFKFWLNKKLFELREKESMEEQIEKEVNNPSKTKCEIKKDGKWVEVNKEYFNNEDAKREI